MSSKDITDNIDNTWGDIGGHYRERAEAAIRSMPIVSAMGIKLDELSEGKAVLSLDMHDDLRQPGQLLHGGVTATLIDTAMAFAVRTLVLPDDRTATIDLTIHYLRPHTEGMAICTANVMRAGKRILTVTADVLNEKGLVIASAISTYTKI